MGHSAPRPFRRLLAPATAVRRPARRARLHVRDLEDRLAPAVFTVTNTNDAGSGSFRQAIIDANAATTADTIQFDTAGTFATPQTISLLTVLPQIPSAGGGLTINGTGAANLTIRRDPGVAAFRVFDSLTAALTMRNFTVSGGSVAGDGAGLQASGTIVLDGMVFSGNQATGANDGGAIRVNSGAFLNLKNSTLTGNSAGKNGGGIYFFSGGSLLMENSTISGNTAAGTAANTGGGGIYLFSTPSAAPPTGFVASNWVIRNSTIANNSTTASGGGIIWVSSGGTLLVQNSTISGNSAALTTAGQGGGGIARTSGTGTVTVVNSVVSGNSNTNGPDVLSAGTVNVNFSAVGSATGFTLTGGNNLGFGAALSLGALANNGGPTQTMLPAAGSPLLDVGSNASVPAGVGSDQRGRGYVRAFNTTVDMGAVEVQPPGIPVAEATAADVTASGGTTHTFTVSYFDLTGSNNGIDVSTVINNNAAVRVTGPNGFDVAATYVSIDTGTNGTPRTATYSIGAPGGSWDPTDNGAYSIVVQANQVKDLDATPVPTGSVGAFAAAVPSTFVVTNANDTGAGSLRDAITQANAVTTSDFIVFDPAFFNTPRTINLQTTLPQVTLAGGGLTITGPGTSLLRVQRDPAAATNFGVLNSLSPNLTLTNFTVAGGRSATDGGGLFMGAGLTTLNGMVFADNVATEEGGAIFVNTGGFLMVQNSTVTGNTAGTDGGGLYFFSGGGLVVNNSVITGNTSSGPVGGGGIYFFGTASTSPPAGFIPGAVVVYDSVVSDNTSTVSGGGGIVMPTFTGTLAVIGSEVAGNSAAVNGGGISLASGSLAVVNSTLSGNSAGLSGGGVAVTGGTGTVTLLNSTIVGNTAAGTGPGTGGGGIARVTTSAGTVHVANTVVAGNTNGNGPDVLTLATGSTVNVNNSAVGTAAGYTPSGTSGANIAPGTDLKLGTIANYGGSTRAVSPLTGSPLINAGSNSLLTALTPPPLVVTQDQRFESFVRTVGGTVDIGAVEVQAPFLPIAVSTPAGVTAAGGTTYTFTVTYADPTGTNNGINTATVINNNSAIRVVGPRGFEVPATFVSIDNPAAGTPRTATYSFTPPGGAWDVADNGRYTVVVQGGQVADADGNFVAAGPAGSFGVLCPLVVTNADDAGTGSLREAIALANAAAGPDAIAFDPSFFNTTRVINLQSALPQFPLVGGALTIAGPAAQLTVQRDSAAVATFRIFDSLAPALTLTGFTVAGGNVAADGAGLQANNIITLDRMTFSGNAATGANDGGAIRVSSPGFLTVRNSVLTGNSAGKSGGGIYLVSGTSLVVENTTVTGNTAASVTADQGGGGIYFIGTVAASPPAGFIPGTLVVRNSTIDNNTSAASGGGIQLVTFTGNTLRVQNSTVAANTAATSGGGIGLTTTTSTGSIAIQNSTIAGNTANGALTGTGGGGIARLSTSAGTLSIDNSVVAGNTNANGPDVLTGTSGSTVNVSNSAIGNATGWTANSSTNNIAPGTDLKLGSLADNGGPTRTLAPQPGSPLINAGSATLIPAGLTTDQRGPTFVRAFGTQVDIGSFEVQPPIVTINQAAGQADPTNLAPITFTVEFNAPVTGFTATDVDLSTGTLTTGMTPSVTGSGRNYTVTVTGMNGEGTVIARIPAGAAVDGSQTGNAASTSTDNTVLFDNVRPAVTIDRAAGQADPTNASPITFTVQFSEPVLGFGASAVDLSGSTVGGTLVPVVTGSGADYTVTVTGMTGVGTVVAAIPANAAADPTGNQSLVSTSTDNSVLFDEVRPTVTIEQAVGQADPTNAAPVLFAVHFSEPVVGFGASAVDLSGSTVGGTLVPVVTGSGADYTVTVTGMTGEGTLVASIPADGATDPAGNGTVASTSIDNSVYFDDVRPTVTIEQAVGQADPTNAAPISFAVHFSEPVSGLLGSDVSFAGSTVGPSLTAGVTGSGQDYVVTVTGMTGDGNLIVSIPAGRANDPAGNTNTASTSSDNTVRFDNIAPTATIAQAAGQPDPVAVGPIVFDVHFSEPVFNFTAVDTSGSTVGGLLIAQITGSGQDYTVSVTGMSGVGTVVVAVPAGAAQDAAGNGNTPAIGDGSVLFDTVGQLQFSAATFTRSEIGGTATITVTRTNGSANAIAVDYATANGTATAGADYTTATGTLSWANGDTTAKTFVIPILDDRLVEGPEGVTLTLSNPTNGASLGAQATATLVITDFEEGILQFSSPTFSATENGAVLATITVTRTAGSNGAVSVDYTSTPGTATATTDYTPVSGTLTWADGDSTPTTFTVPVIDDTAIEGDESVNLALSNPTGNAVIGTQGTAVLNIVDVEEGVLEFSDPVFHVNEDLFTEATFTVTRTAGSDGTVTVNWATVAGGTAMATSVGSNPQDYTPSTNTLTFADGVTTQQFTIPIGQDILNEGRETVLVNLSNPTGNGRLGLTTAATLVIDPSDGKSIVGTDKKPSFAFTDADGDLATVKLTGKVGNLKVYLTDTDGDGKGPIELIEVTGTDPAPGKLPTAALTLTSAKGKGGVGDGLMTVGAVTGTALKSFTATKTDLIGSGINMTGFVGSVAVRDVLNGADILLNGAQPLATAAVKITARQIGNGSDLTAAAPIGTLKAWNYGDGTITAPSIGTMTLTGGTLVQQPGNVKVPVPGDLKGDINLNAAVAAPKAALTTLTVAGSMTATSSITAPSVGAVTVKKDLAGDITVTEPRVAAGKPALKTLKVTGAITGSTIDVAGSITSVTAGAFVDSNLYAGYNATLGTFPVAATVGTFKVTGKTNGFARSYLYATNYNSVTLASVDLVHTAPFGVYAHGQIKALAVTSFGFKYVPGGPNPQTLGGGQFEIRII